MKAPLSWLRELVEIDVALSELRQRLTMAGLEVEDVHQVGVDWRDVTIGRITDLTPHPRRDLLHVARVDVGERTATVVTGASNLRVGDIVPYVAPGGRLPGGEVGRRDLGGIASEGMVCSGDELDISPDKDGIYVFEPDAPVGQAVAEYLNETILDIYITANRPDCMSMMGIARELHALFGAPYTPAMLRLLDPATAQVKGSPGEPPTSELLSIRIEDPVGCPRFTASLVRDIHIGPSPRWLERRLHFCGVRRISNVVDVTNYVMLEVGQPLHAFDRARLGSDTIVVRRAREGERLRTLDGEERELSSTMMVVTDGQRARSLAGIMGGEDSEIADSTREVVLEGASWDRASIRRASAALGLFSEASRRFGRGVDPDLTALGVARATELTLELAGGRATAGLADEYPGRESPRTIDVRLEQIDALIGLHYPRQQVVETLAALGFGVEDRGAAPGSGREDRGAALGSGIEDRGAALGSGIEDRGAALGSGREDRGAGLRVTVPGWRRFDVEGSADLAEEVGRIAGFDQVPSTMLKGALPAPRPEGDGGYADEMRARRVLAAAGLQEVITYSLVDPGLAARLSLDPDASPHAPIRIANPQSVEQSVLRPSLLGGLLFALRSNLRQRPRVLLYELARTWHGSLDSSVNSLGGSSVDSLGSLSGGSSGSSSGDSSRASSGGSLGGSLGDSSVDSLGGSSGSSSGDSSGGAAGGSAGDSSGGSSGDSSVESPLEERRHVGLAVVGPRDARHWSASDARLDFFDIKGVVDALCAAFGVRVTYRPSRHPSLHPGRTAEVCAAGQALGVLGQLHPTVGERFDLGDEPVFVAELDFERLMQARQPLLTVQTPSRFPAADRDISFVVDEGVSHADLEAAIYEAAGGLLEQAQLFDVFRGGNVPAGRKSLAFSLRYRANDRTLEDEEVTTAHARVEEALRTRFGAEIRGR